MNNEQYNGQYQNAQYNNQNQQPMQYQSGQYNNQYQQPMQYQNAQYNNQYQQPQYNYQPAQKKKPDGSGIGGAIGTIVGIVLLIGICVGAYFLITDYITTNKTIICTAQGGGYDVTTKIKLNNKKKEVKSFEMNYTINLNDGLSYSELNTIKSYLSIAKDYKYFNDISGVKYDYNGPYSLTSSELKDYYGKDINFTLKLDRKKAGDEADKFLYYYDNKDVDELIIYLEKNSGFKCHEE